MRTFRGIYTGLPVSLGIDPTPRAGEVPPPLAVRLPLRKPDGLTSRQQQAVDAKIRGMVMAAGLPPGTRVTFEED